MTTNELRLSLFLNRIPIIGIGLFIFLWMYAATLYPGGSQANPTSVGYDWMHNYWCNLLSQNTMNGVVNPARPFAIFAMMMLCLSMVVFFYQVGEFLVENPLWQKLIQWCGVGSMIFGLFIFTSYHDELTIISSLFGLIVVLGIIKEIYHSELVFYKITGAACLFILGINNIIYYTNHFIEWLPLIQKISFLMVLSWVLGLNRQIRWRILNE